MLLSNGDQVKSQRSDPGQLYHRHNFSAKARTLMSALGGKHRHQSAPSKAAMINAFWCVVKVCACHFTLDGAEQKSGYSDPELN